MLLLKSLSTFVCTNSKPGARSHAISCSVCNKNDSLYPCTVFKICVSKENSYQNYSVLVGTRIVENNNNNNIWVSDSITFLSNT